MYFTILKYQYKAFCPRLLTTAPAAESMTTASHLGFAGLSAARPDHKHALLHFSMYPTSRRIRPQHWWPDHYGDQWWLVTIDQSSQQWFSLLLNGRKRHTVCRGSFLSSGVLCTSLESFYWKLDKNLPPQKNEENSLLPNVSHQVLTSDITSDFHYKKIKKVWPCRTDTLFERKRAWYLSWCVQLGLCSPSFWKQMAL